MAQVSAASPQSFLQSVGSLDADSRSIHLRSFYGPVDGDINAMTKPERINHLSAPFAVGKFAVETVDDRHLPKREVFRSDPQHQ